MTAPFGVSLMRSQGLYPAALDCQIDHVLIFRQEKIDFWDNVYGFDMSSIKERALIEPLVDNVDPEQIATSSCQMKTIDVLDMKVEDANFEVRTNSWTASERACLT